MAEDFKPIKIASLKTPAEFRAHAAGLGLDLPCDETIVAGPDSPFLQPVPGFRINGKTIGNRIAIQPMEGWDGTASGGISEDTLRRWERFGESGAKLIFGGEAMAITPAARANPNQLVVSGENRADLVRLRETLLAKHRELHGTGDEPVIGFQLTHSGRFCRPRAGSRPEPRIAHRHPILDRKFNISGPEAMLSDGEVDEIIAKFVGAARIAREAGADFVDIKHCHGYLLHEFLGAWHRPGRFGGSFENRTRILRDIVAGIRADGNDIDLAVRLSAFDFVPFRPDPARSTAGKPGPGIPEDYSGCLPYDYAFGVNRLNPLEPDLTESIRFIELCVGLGVKIINVTAGSPYYNPHIQRPAAYPPSDGYQPAHDPLIDVERQIQVVRRLKALFYGRALFVGSAYSYLQEYLPHVGQYLLRHGWTDCVGLGRMALSYPSMLMEAGSTGGLNRKAICRTFSDCTTAPRNGMVSGCYPLDKYYSDKPEFQKLKEIKKSTPNNA